MKKSFERYGEKLLERLPPPEKGICLVSCKAGVVAMQIWKDQSLHPIAVKFRRLSRLISRSRGY